MRRKGSIRRALGLLPCLLLVALAPGPAMTQGNGPRVPVDQASTEQKARFVENLVTRSVSVQTIENSGNEAATQKLEQARKLVGDAKADLAKGLAEAANAKLNQALRLVNNETRRLSFDKVKNGRLKQEYDRRLNGVKTFLAAYERVAEDKQLSAAAAEQMTQIRILFETAEGLAREGLVSEANDTLERAYHMARGDIRDMREGATLTRSLNFATAEEEYRYEHDRNDSHVVLLQFAVNEKNPPKARLIRIDQLREEAMGLRGTAEAEARGEEFPAAIETIVRSTDTLLKAIRMSGVWVPG